MRDKVEKKQFATAKQYLRLDDGLKAAIEAFDNFILDNPGSTYRAEAFYRRFEAAYKLAINSVESLVPERLLAAKGYYNSFIKYYKDTEWAAPATEMYQDIEARTVSTETEPTT